MTDTQKTRRVAPSGLSAKVPPSWMRILKRHLSIRACILLVYLFVVGGGFYLLLDTVLREVKPRYLESLEESLVDSANILASIVEEQMQEGRIEGGAISNVFEKAYNRPVHAKIYSLIKTEVDLQVYVTDHQGIVLYHSNKPEEIGKNYSAWKDVSATLRGDYGARMSPIWVDDKRVSIMHVAAPILDNERIAGVITVAKPTTFVAGLVENAQNRYLYYGIGGGVAILLLGILLSYYLTRPISRLIRYAKDIKEGRSVELPQLFGMEAYSLGQAFEEMRETLEGKQYAENYVQSLTHQLKSPLSGISGAAELLSGEMSDEERERFLSNVRREADRMRRIVDRMLELASIESRRGIQNVETIDLKELVEDILLGLRSLPEARQIEFKTNFDQKLTFDGERFLVRQAIENTLRNAIEFSSPPGVIEISISRFRKFIECAIEDNGPGIPDYALDRVYERFYSLPRPQTGQKSSGVGLSFVKEIMSLHNGSVELINRDKGGARAILRFPR